MADFTMHPANLFTGNSDDVNFQQIFQNTDFKLFVHDRLESSIKARGSVRDKATFRLLNKEMNNSMEESLTEARLNYDHLQKLSQSNFKDTIKKLKVTLNASNCYNIIDDPHFGILILADSLALLSPKVFKNVKVAEVTVDNSIDSKFSRTYLWISVCFKESLYLKNLKIVNQSQQCNKIEFVGDFGTNLEISNSYFQGIGLECYHCKAHIHNIRIIDAPDKGISVAYCTQSIFEGISVEGVGDEGVNVYRCDTIKLKNISVKNCNCNRASNFFYFSDNLDIQNISICQQKIRFDGSNGRIQDSIIETITHGIILSESQISHRNIIISCEDDGEIFKMDEQSSWTRLE